MGITAPNQASKGNHLVNSNGKGAGGGGLPTAPNAMIHSGNSNGTNNGKAANPINPPNAGNLFNSTGSKMPVGMAATKPSPGAIPVNPGEGGGGAMASFYKRS